MKSIVFAAAALLAVADALPDWRLGRSVNLVAHEARREKGVQQPKVDPIPGVWTEQGCYSSSGDLKKKATLTYNTISNCSNLCIPDGYPVAGSMGGLECWCGYTYPPEEDYEPDGKHCHSGCGGYDWDACELSQTLGFREWTNC